MRERADILSLLLILAATIRVAATLNVLSATTDEPVHVTAGVELLLQHSYNLLPENPPLPRLLFAWPLVRAGVDFDPDGRADQYVWRVLHSRDAYRTNLVLVRLGSVVLFVISSLATWRLARRELGVPVAAASTFFYTTQPLALGFAGIANHDMAATAGVAMALLAFSRWLETMSRKRAMLFGLTCGLATGLKFTALPFALAACGALWCAKAVCRPEPFRRWREALVGMLLAGVAGAFALWACYGFTVGMMASRPWPPETVAQGFFWSAVAAIDHSWVLPAPDFLLGVKKMQRHTLYGMWGYALGRWSREGWWWYFPLGIALKTTLASFALAACAFLSARRCIVLAWLAACGAILLVVLPSNLNLGVRYVLPLYVPLSLVIGEGASVLWRSSRLVMRALVVALVLWHGAASLTAHPGYFAYFNELAGRDPSRYLVDSNLDWGQDVLLLKWKLHEKRVESVGVAIIGEHDYGRLGFPPTYPVHDYTPTSGWVAVSDHMYRAGTWPWLRGRPYERVGSSIRLYYIPSL